MTSCFSTSSRLNIQTKKNVVVWFVCMKYGFVFYLNLFNGMAICSFSNIKTALFLSYNNKPKGRP